MSFQLVNITELDQKIMAFYLLQITTLNSELWKKVSYKLHHAAKCFHNQNYISLKIKALKNLRALQCN